MSQSLGQLKTNSLFSKRQASDGVRILVSRFTPKFAIEHSWDYWLPDLGPEASLLSMYKQCKLSPADFEAKYNTYLRNHLHHASNMLSLGLHSVKSFLENGQDVTLLCYEPEDGKTFCHRHLLKAFMENEYNRA